VSTGAILYGHGTPTHGGISKRFESSHHFVHVSIVGPHIDAKVVRDDGTVIETFALERGHRYDRPNKSDSADDGIGTGESAGCSVSSRPGHGAGTQDSLATRDRPRCSNRKYRAGSRNRLRIVDVSSPPTISNASQCSIS
jgi:hypothetical protein